MDVDVRSWRKFGADSLYSWCLGGGSGNGDGGCGYFGDSGSSVAGYSYGILMVVLRGVMITVV